jgi:hypothetical protein
MAAPSADASSAREVTPVLVESAAAEPGSSTMPSRGNFGLQLGAVDAWRFWATHSDAVDGGAAPESAYWRCGADVVTSILWAILASEPRWGSSAHACGTAAERGRWKARTSQTLASGGRPCAGSHHRHGRIVGSV